jgi:6-phosphogluconolactonase (cycloisomerase 2 family)
MPVFMDIRSAPLHRTKQRSWSRGNNATGKSQRSGCDQNLYFKDGILRNLQTIAPGNGLGFGPRHLDFHPTKPWVFVSIERQNQLYVYELKGDGSLGTQPMFIKQTLMDPRNIRPSQGAGTIHIHPNGRFVYLTNRNAGTVDFQGKQIFGGGENNVAAFSIDQQNAEPNLRGTVDGRGIQLRTFAIDPTGRLLVAASIQPLPVREGATTKMLSAGLSVYRIDESDGKLSFVRKYDVDTAKGTQF